MKDSKENMTVSHSTDLLKNDDNGFSVGLKNPDSFFTWEICFLGPPDTLYEVQYLVERNVQGWNHIPKQLSQHAPQNKIPHANMASKQ